MGRIYGSGRRHSAHDRKQTDLPVKKRNHRADLRYSERTAWISIYAVCRKSTDGNESRAYLCMHEFEKTGKDSGKTRLEYSQIFVDFEKNKKKKSFKRNMVLGITPNTKFVYSLKRIFDRCRESAFYIFFIQTEKKFKNTDKKCLKYMIFLQK